MSGLTSTHKLIEILTNDVIASNCFMKLKEYEDTGLQPEDIKKLINENAKLKRTNNMQRILMSAKGVISKI